MNTSITLLLSIAIVIIGSLHAETIDALYRKNTLGQANTLYHNSTQAFAHNRGNFHDSVLPGRSHGRQIHNGTSNGHFRGNSVKRQSCPYGYPIDCGNGYCCPSGTNCIAGGQCQDPTSTGTCPAGYPVDCNNGYCCPSGQTCLAGGQCENPSSTGTCPSGYPVDCNNGYCCPSGTSCLSGGQCSSSGGGSNGGGCPYGYPVDCNNGYCCPSGTSCLSGGQCSSGGGGGGGGGGGSGTCPAGYPIDCNDGYCCPSGTTCTTDLKCYRGTSAALSLSANFVASLLVASMLIFM